MTRPLEPPPGEAIYAGKHRIYSELPDTLRIVMDGDVSVDDVLGMVEAIAAFERDKDNIFILLDLSQFGTIPADARKTASHHNAAQQLRACALYGATFAQRVLLVLVTKAFAVLKGNDRMRIAAFDTEVRARAWLAEQRRAILAEK
jgi:hypothetical protein